MSSLAVQHCVPQAQGNRTVRMSYLLPWGLFTMHLVSSEPWGYGDKQR